MNLQNIDLIHKRISGKQHYYSINTNHPLFTSLRNIFLKTVGLKEVIQKHLMPFSDQISFCFVYGSIAKNNSTSQSDVDLMIIGDVSLRNISTAMLQAGQDLDREINFSVFSLNELGNRLRQNDHFLTTLFREQKIFVLGYSGEFERLGKECLSANAYNQP